MSDHRKDVLEAKLTNAERFLHSGYFEHGDDPYIQKATQDKKQAERGIKDLSKSPHRANVLKEQLKAEQAWIDGPLDNLKHARQGLKAKGTTLEDEVKDLLGMGHKSRQAYYWKVWKERGKKAVDELLCAVRKSRIRTNELGM